MSIWSNILDFCFGYHEAENCYVIVEAGGTKTQVPAKIVNEWKDSIKIRYLWINDEFHSFIDREQSILFYFNGLPVYLHNLGNLFGEYSGLKLDNEISSQYYDQISNSSIVSRTISAIEDWDEGGGFPWKWVGIIGGGAILIYILWKAGIIPSLLESVGFTF